jgi:inorganic pyrophosphatase
MPLEPLFHRLAGAPDVVIEQPRWSMVKRRNDGRIDFVSPVPCPYNYGSIPAVTSEDGDPLDAVVLGPRLGRGQRLRVPVVGVIGFIDAGQFDPKVVCSARPLEGAERTELALFFAWYAMFKRVLWSIRRQTAPTRSLGFLPESALRNA